ncbi:MAG TPA: hypothetical protein VFV83_10675 [Chthoniobacteraceae bacterium]|nr:hypothetical protein [Chthoniobacteraceae bacterium]
MAQAEPTPSLPGEERNICRTLTLIIQAAITIALVIFAIRHDWENAFLALVVIILTLLPAFAWRRYRLYLPPEFQLIAAAFIFLSLFLGSARDFYYRFWWWDMVLHAGSGFLLGIVGFVALYLLNQTDRLPPELSPGFRCFFGVTFAVFLGVLWEIVEFVADEINPYWNMQTRESGVADTMHDLIVDTIGAVIVALMGWAYFKKGRYSFIADGIQSFIRHNPRLFRKR